MLVEGLQAGRIGDECVASVASKPFLGRCITVSDGFLRIGRHTVVCVLTANIQTKNLCTEHRFLV